MNFPYVAMPPGAIGAVAMPILPIRLSNGGNTLQELALVDSGSVVSVLPYDLGIALGFDWNAPMRPIKLGGNLARHTAKGVGLELQVASNPPVQIVFAWSQHPDAPLLLGQFNFFSEFNVCFYRSKWTFDVKPKP
jgi:hypothetical protein